MSVFNFEQVQGMYLRNQNALVCPSGNVSYASGKKPKAARLRISIFAGMGRMTDLRPTLYGSKCKLSVNGSNPLTRDANFCLKGFPLIRRI
jgi:hypothetical protein